MARKKKRPVLHPLADAEKRVQFHQRYQDGIVELGIGCLILLLTLLNQSEHFFADEVFLRLLVLLQPILSLGIFGGAVFLIRHVRNRVLEKRDDIHKTPLTPPMLWINLAMLLLLIAAPLVWPVTDYHARVIAWGLGGLGCIAGITLMMLGFRYQFQRFLLTGFMIGFLSVLFTFIGQPGSLANQLIILLGVSAVFLLSGGYSLYRFLHAGDSLR